MSLAVGSTGYLDRVAAAIVYLLSVSRGNVPPFRLIIMGIGVGALLGSLSSALMLSSDVDVAILTAVWAAGSLYGLGRAQLWPMVVLPAVMLPLVASLAPGLRQLGLGDAAARGLGIRASRVQAGAVIIGVALTALVTAAAGPISFIALAAPQIARRLARDTGLVLAPAALVGALLLLASEALTEQLGFPVGIRWPRSGLAARRRIPKADTIHTPLTRPSIQLDGAQVGYNRRAVCKDLSLEVSTGSYTAIIGPNACGKSTMLRSIARILRYRSGSILLDGDETSRIPTRALATRLGLLPQTSIAPEGIRVADLVARGRHPHQTFDR